MNKLVIWAVIGIIILGFIFGGYYFMQNSEKEQNQIAGGDKGASIPSDSALKLFDVLEKGLNE